MNKRTLTALNKSIEHWERMRSGNTRPGEEPSIDHCALCGLFFWDNDCKGCPVAEKTKETCCDGSPYEQSANAWYGRGSHSTEFKAAAKKEITFLKSLLPKTKKVKTK
jgi:hypothetical protein